MLYIAVPGMRFFGAESTKIMGCTRIINNLCLKTMLRVVVEKVDSRLCCWKQGDEPLSSDLDNHQQIFTMDMNNSMNFSSVSNAPSQMYEFIPAPPLSSLSNHQEGDGTDSRFKNMVAQNMEKFWIERREEIFNAPEARRPHPLPIACIKRIMKSNEEVKMVSADTPVLFAKACEIFIMELTLRSWVHARDNKRRTVQRGDVVEAVRDEDLLNFLTDFVPMQMHLEAPLAPADHPGVNVPHPVPDTIPIYNPIFPMNMQTMNPSDIAQAGRSVANDPRLVYEMNVHNMNHDFFMRNQEMQRGLTFPSPPPSSDGTYHYRGLK